MPPEDEDKRREHRRRVLKGATILTGIKSSEIGVTIRNMHQQGAEISIAPEVHIPAEFLLYVPHDGKAYRSILRWRHGNRAGLEFIGTEPKPWWHYG